MSQGQMTSKRCGKLDAANGQLLWIFFFLNKTKILEIHVQSRNASLNLVSGS